MKKIEALVKLFEDGSVEVINIKEKHNYLPIGYSKWLEHGEKYGYIKYYNKQYENNN